MMDRWVICCFCWLALGACKDKRPTEAGEAPLATAQQVVDAAIEKHGGDRYLDCEIEFDFRERHYIAWRQGGSYRYERIFTDTANVHYRDVLSNEGFFREIDGKPRPLSAKDSAAFANSVNSVIYFALLPYFLNDAAVMKEYAGSVEINGQPYHRVRAAFQQEGGGKDFDDEYLYWFHRDSATLDYLAYSFHVDGGGIRFREAFNPQVVNGIRFADYRNYKPKAAGADLEQLDSLFQRDGLELLSNIENENIRVQRPAE